MNKDSDITREILLRLLFDPGRTDTSPSGDISPPTDSEAETTRYAGAADGSPAEPDSSGPDTSTVTNPEHLDPLNDTDSTIDSGDVTVVQTHFEALLKRRLRQEIEPRPPLFPWEKTLQDYPDTLGQDARTPSPWLEHLQNLDIPTTLPNDVLVEIFNQCQQVARQTWQTGRRLVEAVEGLFPDQPQTLEHIAGLVSRPAYRSSQAQTLDAMNYETASAPQQVALSMMAAQSIFEALSLKVSAAVPTEQKHWLTKAGTLAVKATYTPGQNSLLELQAQMPRGGTLVLTAAEQTIETSRSGPGELVVHLSQPQVQHSYALDVALGDDGACPLQFQVIVE
jgi:hypothetical protein